LLYELGVEEAVGVEVLIGCDSVETVNLGLGYSPSELRYESSVDELPLDVMKFGWGWH